MDVLTDTKNTKLVDYKTAMRLKKLGFNEPCGYLYTTAIRHNGEDLGSDEQYELEAEGHADEIEYVPGGWLEEHYNKNDLGYLNDDVCSAPFVNDVIDWLETKGIILLVNCAFSTESFKDSEPLWFYQIINRNDNTIIDSDSFTSRYTAINFGLHYILVNILI